jgi:hypothetical protein
MLGLYVVGVANLSGEGIEPKSLGVRVQFVSPCDGCPPLPFIDARGGAKKGFQVKDIVLAAETSSHTSLSVRVH